MPARRLQLPRSPLTRYWLMLATILIASPGAANTGCASETDGHRGERSSIEARSLVVVGAGEGDGCVALRPEMLNQDRFSDATTAALDQCQSDRLAERRAEIARRDVTNASNPSAFANDAMRAGRQRVFAWCDSEADELTPVVAGCVLREQRATADEI